MPHRYIVIQSIHKLFLTFPCHNISQSTAANRSWCPSSDLALGFGRFHNLDLGEGCFRGNDGRLGAKAFNSILSGWIPWKNWNHDIANNTINKSLGYKEILLFLGSSTTWNPLYIRFFVRRYKRVLTIEFFTCIWPALVFPFEVTWPSIWPLFNLQAV